MNTLTDLKLRAGGSLLVLSVFALLACACAGSQGNRDRKKVVPDETQQEAGELQGRQQMMMDELNQTPGERAATKHEDRTRPVSPDESKK